MADVGDVFNKERVYDADDGPSEGGGIVKMPPKADGVPRGIDKVRRMRPLYSILTASFSIQLH